MAKEALTTEEAAEFLGCSVSHLAHLRMQGRGPRFIKISKKTVRYLRDDLIAGRMA